MKYDEKTVDAEQSSYNPLPTLAPRLWLPNFGYSSYSGTLAGLFTFGADAVERHSYTLSALYGPAKQRTWYDFNYLYDGWFPSLKFRAWDIDMTYANLLSTECWFNPAGLRRAQPHVGCFPDLPLAGAGSATRIDIWLSA